MIPVEEDAPMAEDDGDAVLYDAEPEGLDIRTGIPERKPPEKRGGGADGGANASRRKFGTPDRTPPVKRGGIAEDGEATVGIFSDIDDDMEDGLDGCHNDDTVGIGVDHLRQSDPTILASAIMWSVSGLSRLFEMIRVSDIFC